MSQNAYNLNMGESFAGMKADSRFDTVESFIAAEEMFFGRAAGAEAGETQKVNMPKNDNATLEFDADFVTDNDIDGKVNGVAWTTVPFNTDHDTTAADLAAAIDALAGVSCVLDPGDVNKRTFLIETDGVECSVTDVAVTGGASQAGSTVTYSADDVFRGIVLSTQTKEQAQGTGVISYPVNSAVNVLRKGMAWVETSEAVNADDTAYVDVDADAKFCKTSSGNIATGGKFRSTVASAGLALLEINLP